MPWPAGSTPTPRCRTCRGKSDLLYFIRVGEDRCLVGDADPGRPDQAVIQLDHLGVTKHPRVVADAAAPGSAVTIDGPERVPLSEKMVEAARE